MDDTPLTTPTLTPTPGATSGAGMPRARTRRPPRPARPRAATTVSAAILTDRGLAEGYVALPLARLMAYRVWPSVETLNRQLTLLEQYSFTRMNSDPMFKAQGATFEEILGAYAAVTEAVAALTQRLAQNRLTAADRLVLATGDLTLVLPAALTAVPPAPAPVTPPATPPGALHDGTEVAPAPGTLAPATACTVLPSAANGATPEAS